MQGIGQLDVGDLKLQLYNVLQNGRRVNIHLLRPAQKAHAGEHAYETEIVIPMEMRNKDVIDLAATDLVLGHLHLRPFPTVYQEDLILHRDHLGSGMTVESG